MTKKAASAVGKISYDSFFDWINNHANFASDVEAALNEAEARYTQVIQKAAFGWPVKKTTTKSGFNKDGEPIEETTVVEYTEYDWHAALEWLKRQRRERWGDMTHEDLNREIKDLMRMLQEGDDEPDEQPTATTLH